MAGSGKPDAVDRRILRAVAAKAAADAASAEADREYEAALRAGSEAGRSYPHLASLAGKTPKSIEWLLNKSAWGSARERAAQTGNRPRKQRTRPERVPGPGLTVQEAAELAGVTRQTLYRWIESGRVTTAEDERGNTRVVGGIDGIRDAAKAAGRNA